MVRLNLIASLFVAAVSAVSEDQIGGKKASNRLPGAYVFEFEDESDRTAFFNKAGEDGTTRLEFDYKLFKGASIQFSDLERAEELASNLLDLPAVKRMWPVKVYGIPKPTIEWTGTPGQDAATSKKRAVNDTSDDFSPHVMTQVDKLRKEGYTGKGVKIAVIDTGIDYKHPALGGCFGEGCLVAAGTDLVGDNYDGYNEAVPDDDPMDCQGHGTHVAGIIAAQTNSLGFTGAAPDATLFAYRVFGCDGEAANDVLIAAFNQAYEDGADIITASIGGASGWSEEPWAVAVTRIIEKGVPCTLAAGNSGDEGIFYASTAANGKKVSAVASFDNSLTPILLNVSHYTVNGSSIQDFGYVPASPKAWDNVKLPLYAASFDTTAKSDGCTAYPDGTDLSGYIVLVRRGTCTFVQKATMAANAGAKYIMVYNNVAGALTIDVSSVSTILGAGMVTAETGEKWIKLLSGGSTVVLEMVSAAESESSLTQVTNSVTGGALSTYTSWGPTWELDVKPQFGAPGANILSTYPRAKGSYAVLSGTSMATPLVAGIYALVSQVRGSFDPALIEYLLAANADPQVFNDGSSFYEFLAPVPQQGAGLIQAHDAAYATTLLSPSSLSFNDTDHFVESLNFTLKNTGKESVEFSISHVPAITVYTLVENSIYPGTFPNDMDTAEATLKFSESKVTVGAGESVTVEVLPTAPEGLDATRLPVWSGYVAINGTDGSSLSLPYQGLTGSLHNATVLGSEDTWISKSTDSTLSPVPANTTFTLPKPGVVADPSLVNTTSNVYPQLVWYLALGSSKLRADVVPVKITGSYDRPKNGSLGQVVSFPMLWNPMGQNSLSWTGELADGTYAPAGLYKIVYRALRIFGDEKKASDWDKSETITFGIKYE